MQSIEGKALFFCEIIVRAFFLYSVVIPRRIALNTKHNKKYFDNKRNQSTTTRWQWKRTNKNALNLHRNYFIDERELE